MPRFAIVAVLAVQFSVLIYCGHGLIAKGPDAWLGALYACGIGMSIFFIIDIVRKESKP